MRDIYKSWMGKVRWSIWVEG